MTADEYRAALDKLGINQQAASRFFGVGARTSRRWVAGEARIPNPVAMLLQLMVKKKLKLEIPVWNEEAQAFDRSQIWLLQASNKLE